MDEISKAIQGARAAQRGRIYGSFSNLAQVMTDDDAIAKAQGTGEVEENPFEKAAKEAELEKSDIMDAMSYQGNIKVHKSGKEIKKQVDDVLLPEMTATLAVKEAEATKKLADCGGAPTREPDKWWTDGIKMDCGFKIYDWDETYVPNNDGRVVDSFSAEDAAEKKGNMPENQEQANCRREYNDIVRAICNIKVDIKACEILKELKDGTEYELSPRQVLALRF